MADATDLKYVAMLGRNILSPFRRHFSECPAPRSGSRCTRVFDCRAANDPGMMSSAIYAHVYMANQHDINGWRQAHKGFSRDQLLQVLHEKGPDSAEHIAAKQALDSRDQAFQHSIYSVSRRTLCWTVVAAIAAIIAAGAALWTISHH
jgi:hypothetical protein